MSAHGWLGLLFAAAAACGGATEPGGSADGGMTGDGGGSGGGDAPRADADPGGVPMVVAIGKIGRITRSCDGGQTWTFNRSDDDGASCVGIDCDHHAGSSTGLTAGDGTIYASYGWGDHPARILRSDDGATWDTVYDQRGFSFAGVAWAGDRLIGGDVTPRRSMDRGATFTASDWPAYDKPEAVWPNARRVAYTGAAGGRIALLSSSGDWADTTISADGGATFVHPTTLPAACRDRGIVGMATGASAWVHLWGPGGALCRSTDGGDTWQVAHTVPGAGELAGPVFDGRGFVAYRDDRGWRSDDGGATWTEFASTHPVGVVAADPSTGAFVMVRNPWPGDPALQRFYTSSDGATWTELPATAFVASHPITHVAFVRAAGGC
ncbi:MAG: exo-alpha-sialidase [Kofleriaceae bacterium]|nr:exo-alpha-sialidase [Kofleriaceae bacterium]